MSKSSKPAPEASAAVQPKTDADLAWLKVLGAPRSGTTVLQQILNTHPGVACLHEYGLQRLIGVVDQLFTAEDQMAENTQVVSRLLEIDEIVASDDCSELTEEERLVAVGARRQARDFHGEREARVQSKMPLMLAPKRSHFSGIARGIVEAVAGKSGVQVVADKTPNYQNYHDDPRLFARYGIRPRHLMIIRHPSDVINSSLARRDNTLAGGDSWHIKTLNHAIREWVDNWEFAAAHVDDDSYLFVKYEDLEADFANQSQRIADFLGVENRFTSLFEAMPKDLRRYALCPEDVAQIEAVIGDIVAAWDKTDLTRLLAEKPVVIRTLSQPLVLRLGGDEDANISLRNFDVAEQQWRWTLGHSASMAFRLEGGRPDSKAWVEFDFYPYFGPRQSFTLVLKAPDGEQVHHELKAADMRGIATRGIVMPAPDGLVRLELIIPYVKQFGEEPVSDLRPVGAQIRVIRAHLM